MIDHPSKIRVLVVGDVMLDEYWFGDVRRISPEAPVPVVHVKRIEERPGGAANVARNVVSLGGEVDLLSVVGADGTAVRLRKSLDAAGIRSKFQVDPEIRTTLKLRVIGQNQQMLRADFEDLPSQETLHSKRMDFEASVEQADVVVFSDYGKGALGEIRDLISIARRRGKPILVDPKGRDFLRYTGATVVTPNRAELAEMVGPWADDEAMDQLAQDLRARLGLEALIVTLSERGMRLYLADQIAHQPAEAIEVFDVSGAGDSVIAALAIMIGLRADWKEAVAFANAAGSVAVGKLGTSAVALDEVRDRIARSNRK